MKRVKKDTQKEEGKGHIKCKDKYKMKSYITSQVTLTTAKNVSEASVAVMLALPKYICSRKKPMSRDTLAVIEIG